MRKTLLTLVALVGLTASAQYRNPILPGFHPDPSICRVGSNYYMVCSSFEYFPGVPIFHSRDLVNWTQIGNVLDRESQVPLKHASSWTGIYAPTIRFRGGVYYMITTNVGGGGNFMVTARDPRGPWSEPIKLEQQGIDPSLYFEGTKCYMVSNPDNTITLCQIDPKTGRQLTPSRAIWTGTGGRWPEGPHIYKKDGYYYLLISEGGTELAHRLTMGRSKNIYGPYEPCPDNPIFTHCSLDGQTSQIQGTGHGDLVEGHDGRWWLVMLAYRNFSGSYHHLGRETYLAPVEWEKGGWPVVNGGKPMETTMTLMPGGALPNDSLPSPVNVTFAKDKMGPEWVYIQNPDSACYQMVDGNLRLFGGLYDLWENKQPTFVGVRQEGAAFVADTKIGLSSLQPYDEAGICVYQINDGYAQLSLVNVRGDYHLRSKVRLKSNVLQKKDVPLGARREVWLRITSDSDRYYFYYSLDGQTYQPMEAVECSLLSTEVVGGFTGATIGLFATMGNNKYQAGRPWADFEFFNLNYRQ